MPGISNFRELTKAIYISCRGEALQENTCDEAFLKSI